VERVDRRMIRLDEVRSGKVDGGEVGGCWRATVRGERVSWVGAGIERVQAPGF
jgi:hypothetical protein